MSRPVEVWNGAPEKDAICRLSAKDITQISGYPQSVTMKVFKNKDGVVTCLPASDDKFKTFGCMTFDDIGVIQTYIETLVHQCKQWTTN